MKGQQTINQAVEATLKFREWMIDFFGPLLPWFWVISIVISGLLFWGIVYMIINTGFAKKKVEFYMDKTGYGDVGKRRHMKAWHKIVHRSKEPDQTEWKMAILEADKLLDDVLRSSGYNQPSVDERFNALSTELISNYDQVMQAHAVRSKVSKDPEFSLAHAEAIEVLKIYKKALQEFGLID
ncbi:MAG: Uncharacterized protein G01um10143_544 [Parcubacteria group bacterium Gr01-1014_3]|nr:MAG: Uncharacterized protein G01um10143_544 [Parcubacteria group bacterium Gr01-1014_3]